MRIDLEGSTKLRFFQDLYTEARAAMEDQLNLMRRNFEQYKGSDELDGSEVRSKLVRNMTYELVESQVTGYIPITKVTPMMWSEKNERLAKSIEVTMTNKRNDLPFEEMNDIDERYNPIYGGSVWYVEWDESKRTHNTSGDVEVNCLSPMHFVGQPNLYRIKDMEYCFAIFETTKEAIERRYGISPKIADEAESDENADDKTATLYVCYYKDDKGCVSRYIWSADTELSDEEDFYARKKAVCTKCGKSEELCQCEKPSIKRQSDEYEELIRDIPLSDGGFIPAVSEMIRDGQIVTEKKTTQAMDNMGQPLMDDINGSLIPSLIEIEVPKYEPTRLPYYKPTMLPFVIRKNTSEENNLYGQSDVEFIRPQQQAINKIESRILQKVMGGGVYPTVPDDCNVDLDNSVYGKVFRVKQGQAGLYGRLDLSVNVANDITAAERLYEHAKRILGISSSFQGQHDASAQSGKAKQLQIQQAAGRLDSKRRMKNAAYAEIDKIIFQYLLAYADEPRPAVYKDSMGKQQNVSFNRYDFIERDEAGNWYYNDSFLFSCDAAADLESQRYSLWQENRLNFRQGAYGDPAQPQTQLIFWLNMENAHYPFAHDNVERLREQIAGQMAQMQQAMSEQQNVINQQMGEIENRAKYENYLINQIGGKK